MKTKFLIISVSLLLTACSHYYSYSKAEWSAMSVIQQEAAKKEYEEALKQKGEFVQEATPSKSTREFIDGRDYSDPQKSPISNSATKL
jgi:hypothetical protein